MTGDESAFDQGSLMFVRQARKLEVLAQTQSFFSGKQHSSPPPHPLPFGLWGGVLRDVACRDKNGCVGDKQMSGKVRCENARKGKWTSAAHFRARQTKTASYEVFWAVPHFRQSNLYICCFFQVYISDNIVFQEIE